MKLRLRKRIAVAALVGIGALAFALWPRGPALELYTSPPIVDSDGKSYVLQGLVPAGWAQATFHGGRPLVHGHRAFRIHDYMKPHGPGWMPSWLHRLFHPREELYADIMLMVAIDGGHNTDLIDHGVELETERSAGGTISAMRGIDAGPGFLVYYRRENLAEFNATYRQICESFKVIR